MHARHKAGKAAVAHHGTYDHGNTHNKEEEMKTAEKDPAEEIAKQYTAEMLQTIRQFVEGAEATGTDKLKQQSPPLHEAYERAKALVDWFDYMK